MGFNKVQNTHLINETFPITKEVGLMGAPVMDVVELVNFISDPKSNEHVRFLGSGAEALVIGIESPLEQHIPFAAKIFYDSFSCDPMAAKSLVELLCIDGNTTDLLTTETNHVNWTCSGDWHIRTLVNGPRKLFVKKQGDPRINVLKSYWAQILASYHPLVDPPYGVIVDNNSPVGFLMPLYDGNFFSLSRVQIYDECVREFRDRGITVDRSSKGYNAVSLPNGEIRFFDLSLSADYFPGNIFSY